MKYIYICIDQRAELGWPVLAHDRRVGLAAPPIQPGCLPLFDLKLITPFGVQTLDGVRNHLYAVSSADGF